MYLLLSRPEHTILRIVQNALPVEKGTSHDHFFIHPPPYDVHTKEGRKAVQVTPQYIAAPKSDSSIRFLRLTGIWYWTMKGGAFKFHNRITYFFSACPSHLKLSAKVLLYIQFTVSHQSFDQRIFCSATKAIIMASGALVIVVMDRRVEMRRSETTAENAQTEEIDIQID